MSCSVPTLSLSYPATELPNSSPSPLLPSSSYKSRSHSSWIESLRLNTRSNSFHQAISTYIQMIDSGVIPDNFAFPAVLKAVTALQHFDLGKQIHAHAVKFGYESSCVAISNSLVSFYGKCGDLSDACKLFDRMPERDIVSWNSLISAFCRFEEWELAIDALRVLLAQNLEPSSFTLVSMALVCSNLEKNSGFRLGKELHGFSFRKGNWTSFTINSLISMYAKLGRVDDAKSLFDLFDDRNLVTWNTILSSFSQNDRFLEALEMLRLMIHKGVNPDGVTLASVLPACSHLEMLLTGKELHAYALKHHEVIDNAFVGSALVDMYCNCGEVQSGRRVFNGIQSKSIGVWNAMITGYAQNEQDENALMLFSEMESVAGVHPNATTMSSIIPAILSLETFLGKEAIHGYVIKMGLEKDRFVQNALMDLYFRVGRMDISRTIFDTMKVRDTVSWNTMITGHVNSGYYSKALQLMHEMQTHFKPNSVTLMTVLPGCAELAALAKGKEIHAYAIRHLLASGVAVGSALADMYAKCGCLTLSRRVFDQMPVKNVITWNVMIMAYGMHGYGEAALELFKYMATQNGEVRPTEVTFVAVIAACSHSGMVDKGLDLFKRMQPEYGIQPGPDQFACVVDLLGRAGRLEEAHKLINEMPSNFDKVGALSSLLGACRVHQNTKIGEIVARELLELQPNVASHYVLLSNIYASSGHWDKAMDVRRKMKEMGVRKEPGTSWIEHGNEMHKFLAGDMLHPQSEKLHDFLKALWERMKKAGYVPDTSCVLHDLDEEEKEKLLTVHSEKLAIAYGILNTPPGTVIRVVKNLRVCNDCHSAAKFISSLENREIILRDARRFHHFSNGKCSCGDYW